MPIKPENRARYPADWSDVRNRILERARHQCEHDGCKARHRELGYWRDGAWVRLPQSLREAGFDRAGQIVGCSDGPDIKIIMIVLTIAHLDHQPENCADDNLRAWCQRHHLAYDAEHHKANAYRTRKDKARTSDMFEVATP